MKDEGLDQELSALLDGELAPDRARELREEVEADPRLRERLAAFESVEQRLKELPQPLLPSDLRARLQERIDRLEDRRGQESGNPAQPRPRRSSARWGVPLAAALAAVVVAAVVVAAWLVWPNFDSQKSEALVEVRHQLAGENREQKPSASSTAAEDASDEELAIAFELETLRDLDLIQELDLLEALVVMQAMQEEPG